MANQEAVWEPLCARIGRLDEMIWQLENGKKVVDSCGRDGPEAHGVVGSMGFGLGPASGGGPARPILLS